MTDKNYPVPVPFDLVNRLAENSLLDRRDLVLRAYQEGANAELDACLKEVRDGAGRVYIGESKLRVRLADYIWTARRPKPPSLKELNLKHLEIMERDGHYLPEIIADLRRAIESLPS